MQAWSKLDRSKIERFCAEYLKFIGEVRTEREVVDSLVEEAERRGFVRIDRAELKPGVKVYDTFKGKSFIAAVLGRRPIKEGIRLIAAHADSPRLEPKPVPLGEDKDSNLSFLKVGWYGGVVLHQWTSIPLALRGVVVKKDGARVYIKTDDRGITFVAPELLPHLSKKRFNERKAKDVVKGEEIKLLLTNTQEEDSFKKKVLKILKEEYGIEEEDFLRADLEVVPAILPAEVGLDRSMIAAYGQDDRVCVYTGFKALLDVKNPEHTAVFWAVDKEEVGSETNTSAQGSFLQRFVLRLISNPSQLELMECFSNSKAVSADVNAAMNPSFKEIYDSENAAKLGNGVVLSKVGIIAGEYDESLPHAEFMAWVIKVLDDAGVPWQVGALVSKAERIGGGGTIAKYLARLGMDVVDMGCPILGMHSPYEVSSKADVYSCYLAYRAFYLR